MKVLITGGGGYVGQSLAQALQHEYAVTSATRKDFTLTDYKSTETYLIANEFDVVIHCAVQGGNRLKTDTWRDMDNNLLMYYNLLQCKHLFGKLIHFGSGAQALETPYGLSKRIIANSISEVDGFYDLKVFAVFSERELDTRFIKSNVVNYINRQPIVIHQDKFMDFFYIDDLISLVKLYLQRNDLPKSVDCSYSSLHKLSDIANLINQLSDYRVDVVVNQKGLAAPYYGIANNLTQFVGLEQGIANVYKKLKQ